MNEIFIIFQKELKEVLRDRRTLMFMIFLPLVGFPLLFGYLFKAMDDSRIKAETEILKIGVVNGDELPAVIDSFRNRKDYEVTTLASTDDIKDAIRSNQIKIAVALVEGSGESFENGEQVGVFLYYNDATTGAISKRRVQTVLDGFNDKTRRKRLREHGIRKRTEVRAIQKPVALETYQIASAREELGTEIGGMLPYFFIILSFVGATHPAVDLGAGEKERGTLETLLLTPVPRTYLVLGKFLIVFSSAITSALLCLVGMSLMIFLKGGDATSGLDLIVQTLGLQDMFLMALMLIPIAAIFAALLLSISIYAKSQKEAGSTITPFNFIIIVPAMVATLPGVELSWTMAMIPITNVALAIKEIAKGTMDWSMLLAILGSSTLLAGVMLAFCIKWFQKEDVLFRS